MSVITFSYGSCDIRSDFAEAVAKILGYDYISREVVESASRKFDVQESKLTHAIHQGSSFFSLSETTRNRYIAYLLAAAAEFMLKDNLVYNSLASHVIARGISHVMKVRLTNTSEDRIQFHMNRDSLSREKAEQVVSQEEKSRKKWSSLAFGLDDSDPSLYDLSLDFHQIDKNQAIDLIVSTIEDKKYQPMTYSLNCARNAELSFRLRAILIDLDPEIQVYCRDGNVSINTKAHGPVKQKNRDLIQKRLETIADVKQLAITMRDDLFQLYEGIMR